MRLKLLLTTLLTLLAIVSVLRLEKSSLESGKPGLSNTSNTSDIVRSASAASQQPPEAIPITPSESRLPRIALGDLPVEMESFGELSGGRGAAVAYSRKYWNKNCDCGYNYYREGGDCAHFVSHCLLAGGLDNRGFGRGWKGNEEIIVACANLYRWLVPKHGAVVTELRELKPGDVIFYGEPFRHVALYLGGGKVTAHSQNRWGENYLLGYSRNQLILVHIKYP